MKNPTHRSQWEKEYGVGDDPISGFFILPDGLFLLGRAVGQDHRNIGFVAPLNQHKKFYAAFAGAARLMLVIMRKHRLVRWIPEGWAAHLVTTPTAPQIRIMRGLTDHGEVRLLMQKINATTGVIRGAGFEHVIDDPDDLEEEIRRFWKMS